MSKIDDLMDQAGELAEKIGADMGAAYDRLQKIEARLSKLEAWSDTIAGADAGHDPDYRRTMAPKPQPEPAPQREPGLYPVELENGLFKIRRWTSKKRWVNQSGYTVIDASDPVWIGPRIPEPRE